MANVMVPLDRASRDVPKLAGQSAEYIANQLKAWKDGKRTNDPLHLMAGISGKLNDRQVAAVAAYYANLPAISTTFQGLNPMASVTGPALMGGRHVGVGPRRVDRLHIGRK